MSSLQLAHIVIEEIRIKEQFDVTTVDEETCYRTPYVGWKRLEVDRMMDEPIQTDETETGENSD